jgi:hypothetical protein
MTPHHRVTPPSGGGHLDLILVGEPDLTPQEIQKELDPACPEWCHLGYRSHSQTKAHPALPAPVLVWNSDKLVNNLLVQNNRLVFVLFDTSENIKTIWQLQSHKGQSALVSPYNSEILGGHFIHTIPELVSILLEGW